MNDNLLVLIGASQFANVNDGGQFLYSVEDRGKLSNWDLHIVDPTTDINDVNETTNLLRQYHHHGSSSDNFIREPFETYFFGLFENVFRGQYKRVVFISYTCGTLYLMEMINGSYQLPAFTFGHASYKLDIDMLMRALTDYTHLIRENEVRLLVDNIIKVACNEEGTVAPSWEDNAEDIQKNSQLVDRLLSIDCDRLNELSLEYVQHATQLLRSMSGENLDYRRGVDNKPLGPKGKTRYEVCGREIYKYKPRQQIGGFYQFGGLKGFQDWLDYL